MRLKTLSSFSISAGSYTVNISPAVQTSGNVSERGDGPYELAIQFYNTTVSFTTRPTVSSGSLGNQPEFS